MPCLYKHCLERVDQSLKACSPCLTLGTKPNQREPCAEKNTISKGFLFRVFRSVFLLAVTSLLRGEENKRGD